MGHGAVCTFVPHHARWQNLDIEILDQITRAICGARSRGAVKMIHACVHLVIQDCGGVREGGYKVLLAGAECGGHACDGGGGRLHVFVAAVGQQPLLLLLSAMLARGGAAVLREEAAGVVLQLPRDVPHLDLRHSHAVPVDTTPYYT